MSELTDRLEKELDEGDQLSSLRVQYSFEGRDDLEGAGEYYRATGRSGEGPYAVRFFDLETPTGLQGLDATQNVAQRSVSPPENEAGATAGDSGEGLGEVASSVQDAEEDAIDAPVASAEESSGEAQLEFERADLHDEDLLARLSHPNLVEVEAYRRGERTLAVVAEEVDGHALSQHVYDGSLQEKPDRAATVAREVARALQCIHERGVLHLGIKPENVLRDHTGDVRLLNVGVLPLIEETMEEGEIRATPEYLPPERIDRDDDRIGPWTDLYSLGVLLYRAATGRAPFSGASAEEVLEKQLHEYPQAPRSVNSKISPFLERVIRTLLAKDPADRYRTADELAWDLETYLEKSPSERFDVRREPRVWDTGLSSAGGVFFGRREEMDRLTKHLTVEADRPRVFLMRGSRGVGKSALLEHQIERLERRDLGPVYARAAGDLDSVAAVVMLARGAVRKILEGHQFDTEAWTKHFRDASPAARTLVSRIPRLGRLFPGEPQSPEPGDDNRRALMRNVIAWRDLFELFVTGPDVITWIVDDLHRLGELSGEIIAEFVHRRNDVTSRWLASQSPGERPNGDEWIEENVVHADAEVEILGLESIGRGEVREYFGDLLHPSDELLERFVDRVMGVSGGRPELIQIALQQLTDAGVIDFRAGKLRVDDEQLESVELAEDLVDYALEAWEELDSGEKELAYYVALVGDCIPASLLLEIVSVSAQTFERQLSTLVARRILETTPTTQGRLVSCSESTVREFVRKQLTPSEFERRHRMLAFEFADYFELVDEDRFDDGWLCVNAAQQWVAAGEPERAVDWLARGGRIRMMEGRVSNALQLFREGQDRTDEPFEVRAAGLSLIELLGDALAAAGEGEEAVECYTESLRFSGDFDEQQRLRLKLGRGLQHRQDYDGSYTVVSHYLEDRGVEVPTAQERLAFGVPLVIVKFLAVRALYRLGVVRTEEADDAALTRELDNFGAARLLVRNLRHRDRWFPLIWLELSTELRAHQLQDSRALAVNFAGHARMCTELPWPLPDRAEAFRDLALEQVQMVDDERVRSYVGASAAAVSMRLGDHEEAIARGRQFRPVAVREGAFSDYQDILETLIYLALYGGHLSAAEQLVHRFVADARAFGTYEVAHLTNYLEAYVEFLRGDYAAAREHLGQSRSANQRTQDATYVALQDWIDFELLWRYGQRREALTTAREAVDNIEEHLRDPALDETICRAARLASRAALEAREGNLQENPGELLEFAERCCDLADARTEAFPSLRAMVHCEQGRLAWVREHTEEAIGRLDQAVLAAESFGQMRFQAVAYEVRSHVKADETPLHALVDARRARALYETCGFSKAVERLEEDIATLLETEPDLEAFSDRFGIRSPEASELEPSEQVEGGRNPFRTIELEPEAEEVEVVEADETLRPWEHEESGLASLVPPSPEDRGADQRFPDENQPESPALEEIAGDNSSEPRAQGDRESDGELPMPPSPDKPGSLENRSSPSDDESLLPSPSAATSPSSSPDSAESSENSAESGEEDGEVDPPTLPDTAGLEPAEPVDSGDDGGEVETEEQSDGADVSSTGTFGGPPGDTTADESASEWEEKNQTKKGVPTVSESTASGSTEAKDASGSGRKTRDTEEASGPTAEESESGPEDSAGDG